MRCELLVLTRISTLSVFGRKTVYGIALTIYSCESIQSIELVDITSILAPYDARSLLVLAYGVISISLATEIILYVNATIIGMHCAEL